MDFAPPITHTALTEQQRERIRKSREEALKRRAAAAERQKLQSQLPIAERSQQQEPIHVNIGTFAAGQQPSNFVSRANSKLGNVQVISSQTSFKPQRQNINAQEVQINEKGKVSSQKSGGVSVRPSSANVIVEFKFSLVNSERFKLEFHPFEMVIPTMLKEISSRNYNSVDKSWTFLLKDYELVKQKLAQLRSKNIAANLNEIPLGVRKLFLDKISPCNSEPSLPGSSDLSKADPKIVDMLFPFQRRGASYGIHRGGRLLIADEMGLGKTVQALAIASAFRIEWPLLIVCPSSVKYIWARQISRFLPNARPCMVEKAKDHLPNSRCTSLVIIMSYNLMEMRREELKRQNFYVLIFDECHMLKEAKTKRTRVADALSRRAHRIILLSGTPALSRPAELFTQIRMVDPNIFPVYKHYAVRYCDGRMGRYGFEAKGQSNPDELKAVMDKIMIRRLKKDVLEDLPEKRREIIFLSGDAIDTKMRQLRKAKDEFENASHYSIDNRTKKQTFMEYYVLSGQVKMKPVSEHIVDTYFYDGAPAKKILVFAHHLEMLNHIGIELAKAGVQYIRIDGSTPAKDRAAYCEQFQSDKRTRAALLSITAAGTGITLTAASVVIFAELYWNPSLMIQAEDRAHRVGQRDSVQVQYMIAKKTADMDLWQLVGSKLQVLGTVNLANENYSEADRSDKFCSNSQKITDFFEMLSKCDEEEKKEDGGKKSPEEESSFFTSEIKRPKLEVLDKKDLF